MELIVFGAVALLFVVLLFAVTRRPSVKGADRVTQLEGVYQELIEAGQQAKQIAGSETIDQDAIAAVLSGFQKSMNRLALVEEAAEVYNLADTYRQAIARIVSARKQPSALMLSEEALDPAFRDMQEAARDSLSRLRRGETVRPSRQDARIK